MIVLCECSATAKMVDLPNSQRLPLHHSFPKPCIARLALLGARLWLTECDRVADVLVLLPQEKQRIAELKSTEEGQVAFQNLHQGVRRRIIHTLLLASGPA